MRKTLLILSLALGFSSLEGSAQSMVNASATASQTVNLELAPVISIEFTNTGTASGGQVSLPFNTINHYNNGVTSGSQELHIRSNKTFKISVQTAASSFAYSGGQSQTGPMPVDNTLFLAVTGNATGGNISSAFNNGYSSLSSSSQDLVLNGQRGGDQNVVLAYQAKPGLGFASGTYSVGVVYTATQP